MLDVLSYILMIYYIPVLCTDCVGLGQDLEVAAEIHEVASSDTLLDLILTNLLCKMVVRISPHVFCLKLIDRINVS